jgi:ABC transport system ATP-binding/permease protein
MPRSLLLGCQGVGKAHGTRSLFEAISLGVFEGDRVGLVGANGSGKSTLLRILAGLEAPDAGSRSVRGGVRIGHVAQDPVLPASGTVEEAMSEALAAVDDADRASRLAMALGRAGFADGTARVETLSGGWRKRLAIARALVADPDVLLLDEPTNHLDIDGVLWLESLLTEDARAVLVVSHDRYFLERVATRMLELGAAYPGGLFESDGPYSELLVHRDEFLRGQAAYEDALANTVRREIAWLRQGAKARSTKAKGRIKEAGRLQGELEALRERGATRSADIELAASGRRTRRLLTAQALAKSRGPRRLIDGLDLTVTPGTRVGVIGPNGSGKTTLLDLLAGDLAPDAGAIERADGLQIVRFAQDRSALHPDESLRRALAPVGDTVFWQGRPTHVAAWAKRFLFRPEQLDLPVGRLSGGEQARVLIARLMLEPADLVLLDEPTNDLDIPTLEVLEDNLASFAGALVLVTHDRFLLERVSTVVLALDGSGGARLYADYDQWLAARADTERVARTARLEGSGPRVERDRPRSKRLGYLDQREWDGMEEAILEAEAAADAARRAAEDPAIAADAAALRERYAALEKARASVERLYARWAELEAKQA